MTLQATALLGELRALAQAEDRPLPGEPELHQRLATPHPAPAVWLRLAHALHQERLRGPSPMPQPWCRAFLQVMALGWAGQAPAQQLAHGLYPAWLRCAAELGETALLQQALALHGPAWQRGEHTGAALVLLRLCKRMQLWEACQHLVEQLGAWLERLAAWPPEWPPEIAGAVAQVSRGSESLATLGWAHAWLPRLLVLLPASSQAGAPLPGEASPAAAQAPPAHWPLLRELAVLALNTLDLPALRLLSERLCRDGIQAPVCVPLLVDMLGRLAQFDAAQGTDELLDLAGALLPQHPLLALERAKRALLVAGDELALPPLFEPLDPGLPGYAGACSWLAAQLAQAGEAEQALAWYQRMEAVAPLGSVDQMRRAQLLVRQGPEAEAAPDAPWFDDTVSPVLLQALAPLTALLQALPFHGAGPTLHDWARRCAQTVEAFAQALAGLPGLAVGDALTAARQLQLLERAHANAAQWQQAFAFDFSPAYGRVDPQRYALLQQALVRHLLALADRVLRAPEPLQGGAGRLRQLMELARLRCEAALVLGEAEAAWASLALLDQRLGGGMARAFLDLLRERCALACGDLAEAARLRAGLRCGAAAQLWPLRHWQAWGEAAQASPQVLLQCPAEPGHFESVQGDGRVLRFAHATLPTTLSLLPLSGVQVRNSHLLIHPQAGVLLPEPWHLAMGDYPYEHPSVLNTARRACALQPVPAARQRRVAQPVLVLANMDATYHRNFYHWMLLILTRVEWLRAQGWLARRPLLMPEALSGWMRSSLQDIGVPPEQLLFYREDEALTLEDALVVSALEYSCRPLLDGLSARLWQAAGLDPAQPPVPQRLLYVSRQSAHRRPLVNEEQLMAQALALGFERVAPETLSLLEQVRLFAQARGIAGPPGAAFTNLAWCQPGTRVLALFKEEVNLPTFVDLSVQRGQQHRWLLGHNLAGFDRARVVAAPFAVSPSLAHRELAWVAGGPSAPVHETAPPLPL